MSTEPCGSLPVVHVGVSASYCEHHMAWSATTMVYRQTSDEELEYLGGGSMRFGPFDTSIDVVDWLMSWVVESVNAQTP